jgi:hypothetical protein
MLQDQHVAEASFTSHYLEEKRGNAERVTPEDEEIIKATAASLYSGKLRLTYCNYINPY